MAKLKLTDNERLIIANQYEILAALHEDESYSRMAETLRDGYEWLYSHYFNCISPNLPSEKSEFVLSVLELYSDLQYSYEKLSDKSGIDAHQIAFPGFDGNNEADLLGFVIALRKHDRYVTTIGEHAKNSHMPTIDIYQRMLSRRQELGQPSAPFGRDVILEILAARTHPSQRE